MNHETQTQRETEERKVLAAYRCITCETISESILEEPLYECSDCGAVFNPAFSYTGYNHQCPYCCRFASKIADCCCAECEEGKVDEIYAYINDDVEYVECDEDAEASS